MILVHPVRISFFVVSTPHRAFLLAVVVILAIFSRPSGAVVLSARLSVDDGGGTSFGHTPKDVGCWCHRQPLACRYLIREHPVRIFFLAVFAPHWASLVAVVAILSIGLQEDCSAVLATTPDPASAVQLPLTFPFGPRLVEPMFIPHAWLVGWWFQALEAFVFLLIKTPQGAALLATHLTPIDNGLNFIFVRVSHQICAHLHPATQMDNAVRSAVYKK